MTAAGFASAVEGEIRAQSVSLGRTSALLARHGSAAPLTARHTPVFAGCDTSYHLAQSAAAVARTLAGGRAVAVPAGDAWMHPEIHIDPEVKPCLVAISRSGTTTEPLLAARLCAARSIPVLAVSVDGRDLRDRATGAITLDHAHEDSVIMTQSFTNLLLALHWVAARWAGAAGEAHASSLDGAAAAVASALDRFDAAATAVAAAGHRHFVFLGSGAAYAVALEGMLKMKEMTQLPAEAYHTLEFRHGPISTVERGSLVLMIASRAHLAEHLAVARDVKRLAGVPLLLTAGEIDASGFDTVALPAGFDDLHAGLLAAPFLQLLALHQTAALGLDPDAPRHLSPVVTLSGH